MKINEANGGKLLKVDVSSKLVAAEIKRGK